MRFDAARERVLASGVARCEVGEMTTPSGIHRSYAMLRDALTPSEVATLRRGVRTGGLAFDVATLDSIDGAPVSDARFLIDGTFVGASRMTCEVDDAACDDALGALQSVTSRLEAHVQELLGEDGAVITDGFLRRYRVGDEAAAALPPPPSFQRRGSPFLDDADPNDADAPEPPPRARRSLPMHFDSLAFATVVIDLDPRAHDGGLAVQSGPHGSTRRVVPFDASGRDAFVHRYSLWRGSPLGGTKHEGRYSHVVQMHAHS